MGSTATFDTFGSKIVTAVTEAVYPTTEQMRAVITNFVADTYGPFEINPALVDIMRYVDKLQLVRIAMLMKRIVPEGLNKVCIGPSKVHGNGVFATTNIQAGELLTVYPCDVVCIDNPEGGMRWYRSDGENLTRTEAMMFYSYLCKVEPSSISIAGDPDKHPPAACGHMINDGAYLDTADFGTDEALAYMEQSARTQNCHFVSLAESSVVAVSTEPIKKGDEVLASYGAEFWGHIARRCTPLS